MSNCKCSDKDNNFDAKLAYESLLHKNTQLTEIVAEYMMEAGLNKTERVSNAMDLAEMLLRIIGGRETSDFIDCAFLNTNMGFCTGVLVHPRIVLTAAHCQDLDIRQVLLNCTRLGDPNTKTVPVQRVRVHPLYRPATSINDIMVLILQNDAPVPHVPIATTADFNAAQITTLVGFGRSEVGSGVKREVNVNIDRPTDINEAETRLRFESDLEFIAGGRGFDSCNGDSGGPAYISSSNGRRVVGLTSRGFPPRGTCGEGGIYTRVDVHSDFIKQVAQESGIDFS